MNTNFKYNFLILGINGYYLVGYHDAIKLTNVQYYTHYKEGLNFFEHKVARLTFSKEVNKIVKHPLSCFTFPKVFKCSFEEEKPICALVFAGNYYLLSTSYLDYFKKKYPDCKMVMYYQDKVSVSTPGVDMDCLKTKFDMVYSYNRQDCDCYGLEYYPTPYSRYQIPDSPHLPDTDVFFCGRAKTRIKTIIEAYEKLRKQGLRCDFYLSAVPDNCPKLDGICYNQPLTYVQYLQHLSHARCVLEVQQEGADGFTPRLWESIMFDKHLLTNNKAIFHSPYYNAAYMHGLDTSLPNSSDWLGNVVQYSIQDKESLSPINLLQRIEKDLDKV